MDEGEGVYGNALRYVTQLGFSVLPLAPAEKTPAIRWLEYQSRPPTDAELDRWFSNGSEAGVGIVTGAVSGLLVVDVDGPEGEAELLKLKPPRTVAARTGKGMHLYFRHPGGSLRNGVRIRPGIDIRADGGYVVAPPSLHPNGTAYTWLPSRSPWDCVLAPAPVWAVTREPTKIVTITDTPTIPHGERNDSLARLAGAMRRVGGSEDAIAAALIEANRGCDPPLDLEEVLGIAASVSRYDPDATTSDFDPRPLDYSTLIREGIPEFAFTSRPYLPAASSVWGAGAAESGKSMFAMSSACELSRQGVHVVYVSQANPLQVDLSRIERLRPDPEFLTLYHYAGWDLARPEHVARLAEATADAALLVLDTLTACWSGNENDTAEVVAFDRDVVRRLITPSGLTVFTLDHAGHPQAFVARKTVNAPRGSFAKGQKADVVLVFKAEGDREFSVEHAKNRFGGTKEPKRQFRVEDDADENTLELVLVETSADVKVVEVADAIVAFVMAAEEAVSTRDVMDAMKGHGGRESVSAAFELLTSEYPLRVCTGRRTIPARDGKRRSVKAWWPA